MIHGVLLVMALGYSLYGVKLFDIHDEPLYEILFVSQKYRKYESHWH